MKREYNISAVTKVVKILDYLTANPGSSYPALCRDVDIPKSSLYQMLQAMLQDNLVRISNDNLYYVGFSMFRYGQAALHDLDISNAAHPIIKELASETGLTTHMGILNEKLDGVFIDRVDGKAFTFTHTRIGAPILLETSATGRALVAWQSRERRDSLVRNMDFGVCGSQINTPEEYIRQCELWIAQGYAVDAQESQPNINGIGAPVFDYTDRVCAAVACGGLAAELDINDCRAVSSKLIAAAKEISYSMGWKEK